MFLQHFFKDKKRRMDSNFTKKVLVIQKAQAYMNFYPTPENCNVSYTDYRHTMAQSLILCGQISSSQSQIDIWDLDINA